MDLRTEYDLSTSWTDVKKHPIAGSIASSDEPWEFVSNDFKTAPQTRAPSIKSYGSKSFQHIQQSKADLEKALVTSNGSEPASNTDSSTSDSQPLPITPSADQDYPPLQASLQTALQANNNPPLQPTYQDYVLIHKPINVDIQLQTGYVLVPKAEVVDFAARCEYPAWEWEVVDKKKLIEKLKKSEEEERMELDRKRSKLEDRLGCRV